MQPFLKKVFRKDVIAITQNVFGLVHNLWVSNTARFFNNISTIYTNWLDKNKVWFQNKWKEVQEKLHKFLFGEFLRIPIIIYQPGKVGSITVHRSLKEAFRKLDLDTPIHHAHNLNKLDTVKASVKKNRKAPAATLKKLDESQLLRDEIDQNRRQRWNIVSLVRDPVALRVSTLFQLLDEYIPNWAELSKEGKLSILDLQKLLINRPEFDPLHLSTWFNNQVKPLFGFDVFAIPFDTKAGYKIYRWPLRRFSFMIIRLEDLNRVAPEAFNEFLELDDFQLINQNIGDEKPYKELYKQFKSLPLPADYLDAAYSTKYARHFYTADELQAFRQRWLHPEIKNEN